MPSGDDDVGVTLGGSVWEAVSGRQWLGTQWLGTQWLGTQWPGLSPSGAPSGGAGAEAGHYPKAGVVGHAITMRVYAASTTHTTSSRCTRSASPG